MSADTLMNIIKARGCHLVCTTLTNQPYFLSPLFRVEYWKKEKREKRREKKKQKNKRSIRKLILIRESAATGYTHGVASVNNLNALPDKNI